MLNAIWRGIRIVILVLDGYHHVVLEIAALRQQWAVFKRDLKRPRLRRRDRLFWTRVFSTDSARSESSASGPWDGTRIYTAAPGQFAIARARVRGVRAVLAMLLAVASFRTGGSISRN
jgi:hypothetical protein